jgi:hypothetical protein
MKRAQREWVGSHSRAARGSTTPMAFHPNANDRTADAVLWSCTAFPFVSTTAGHAHVGSREPQIARRCPCGTAPGIRAARCVSKGTEMTDRIRTLTVVLPVNTREDDVQPLIDAIRMLRGVLDVKADVADSADYFAVTNARAQLRSKLLDVLMEDYK